MSGISRCAFALTSSTCPPSLGVPLSYLDLISPSSVESAAFAEVDPILERQSHSVLPVVFWQHLIKILLSEFIVDVAVYAVKQKIR
jgi:hypothetical protein